MPVRMRCPECEKVLNVPDKARGRSIKCPQCEFRIKVPAGKGGAGKRPAGQRPKKRPQRSAADEDGDIFDNLDLRQAEDRHVQLCPKCAAEVDEDDIECPECGVDLETGKLSEQQRKKRERKGPDPQKFYSVAWSDPFEYMLQNWKICLKLGWVLAICMSFAMVCFINQQWCLDRWMENVQTQGELGDPESKEVFDDAKALVLSLQPQTNPDYVDSVDRIREVFNEVRPLMAWRYEPALFWGAIGMMFYLCFYGWWWFVTLKILDVTMEKKKPLEKVKLDFFATVALGVKALVWPYVLVLPFFWFPPAWLLPLIAYPIAMIHFNQRYSYKSYLPTEMCKIIFRMPGPTFYYLLIVFTVGLIHVAGVITSLVVFGASGAAKKVGEWAGQLATYAAENVWDISNEFWRYVIWGMPAIFLISLAICIPFFMTAGFPMVYLMRANGLLGRYFRPELELENQKAVGQPCGFWPRWLAYLIDGFVILVLVFLYELLILVALLFVNQLGMDNEGAMAPLLGTVADTGFTYGGKIVALLMFIGRFIFPMMYFVTSESGLGQATLGKRALGIIVVDEDKERISKKTAFGRYFGKIISALPLLAGFFMAGFDKNKQALHDKMAKTLVVWRGDDETTS